MLATLILSCSSSELLYLYRVTKVIRELTFIAPIVDIVTLPTSERYAFYPYNVSAKRKAKQFSVDRYKHYD